MNIFVALPAARPAHLLVKRWLLTLLLTVPAMFSMDGQNSLHLNLFDQHHRGDVRYSGSWAYIDSLGNEYALLGTKTGTAIYAIDQAPVTEVGFIPGPPSNWREITVWGTHAFVTTEGTGFGEGMQVIALHNLPDTAFLVTTFHETFNRGHIIQRDIYSEDPFVYVIGTTTTGGIHILDVSIPHAPVEVGLYQPDYYLHDCHIKGNLLFAAAFYEGTIDIVDISDKSQPVLLTRIADPGGNTHSSWITEDNRYLVVCDELDGLPARVFHIENPENAYEVASWTANPLSLVHNPYIKGDFLFVTHNTEGLRVLDIRDPEIPVEVAYYDTWDGPSGGFNGLWSACPFLPSGKIVGGNREDGLYVWTMDPVQAGRFYGLVTDSITGIPVWGANILIRKQSNGDTLYEYTSTLSGSFRGGSLTDTFLISVEFPGYHPYGPVPFHLAAGDSLFLPIQLNPVNTSLIAADLPNPDFILYPNPGADQIQLRTYSVENQNLTFNLLDLNGRLLYSTVLQQKGVATIDVQALYPGIYLYQIRDRAGTLFDTGMWFKGTN